MSDAAGNVVPIKPRIDIDGRRKGLHRIGNSGRKPAPPELLAPRHPRSPADFRFWILDFRLSQIKTQNFSAPDIPST
jgi:hypothetical protein